MDLLLRRQILAYRFEIGSCQHGLAARKELASIEIRRRFPSCQCVLVLAELMCPFFPLWLPSFTFHTATSCRFQIADTTSGASQRTVVS